MKDAHGSKGVRRMGIKSIFIAVNHVEPLSNYAYGVDDLSSHLLNNTKRNKVVYRFLVTGGIHLNLFFGLNAFSHTVFRNYPIELNNPHTHPCG